MLLGFHYAFVALLAIFRVRASEGILDITNQINNLISAPILPAVDSLVSVYGDPQSTNDGRKLGEQRESIAEDNPDYLFNLESQLKLKLPTVNIQIILDKDQPEPKSIGDVKYFLVDRFTNRLYNPGITLKELLRNFTPSQIQLIRSSTTSRTDMRDLYMKLLRNALSQSNRIKSQSQARGQGLYQSYQKKGARSTTTYEEKLQGLAQSQQQSELKQSLNQTRVQFLEDQNQEDQASDVTNQAQAQNSEQAQSLIQAEALNQRQAQTQSQSQSQGQGLRLAQSQLTQGQSQSQVQAQSQAEAINQSPQSSEDTSEDEEQAQSQIQSQAQELQSLVQSQAQEQQSQVQSQAQEQQSQVQSQTQEQQSQVQSQTQEQQSQVQSQAQEQQSQVQSQAQELQSLVQSQAQEQQSQVQSQTQEQQSQVQSQAQELQSLVQSQAQDQQSQVQSQAQELQSLVQSQAQEQQSQVQSQTQEQQSQVQSQTQEQQSQVQSQAQEQQSQVQSQTQEQQSLVQAGDQAKEDPVDQSLHQAQSEVLRQVLSQTNNQSQAQAQSQAAVVDEALEAAHDQYQSVPHLQGIALPPPAQQSLLEAQGQAREDPVDQSLHQAQNEVLKQVLSQNNSQSRAQAQAQAQALDQTLEQAHFQYQSAAQAQGTPPIQPVQQPQLQEEDQSEDTTSDEFQPYVALADQYEKQDQIANEAFDRAEGQLQRQSQSESQAQLQAVDNSLHLAQAQVEEQEQSGVQSQSNVQPLAISETLGQAHSLLPQPSQSQSEAQGLAASLPQSPQQQQLHADDDYVVDQSLYQNENLAQDSVVDHSLHEAQAEIQDQLDSQAQASGHPLAQSQQHAQAQTVEALTQSLTQAHAQIQGQDQSQSQSQTSSNSEVLFQRVGRSQSKLKSQVESSQGPKSDDVLYSGIQARYQYISEAEINIVAKLETPKLIQKYGIQVETHFAFTSDGYKLCLHRIPRPGAIPVLLVHGLMASSATWVQFGPSQGLAYILSQSGYDVWMLNTRGNIYSEERQAGRQEDRDFWDFSFHEIGQYDLPAAIDLILLQTKMARIQYIGHSQGSTAFFVMCSERPEYAAKISLMQSLSPTVYMEGTRSPALKFIGILQGGFTMLLNLLGGHKISLENKIITMFRENICDKLIPSRICAIFEFVVCGFNFNSFNMTLSPILEGHASQGASAKQIYHFAQMQGKSVFQKFDYGLILNKIRYNSILPPLYNLSLALSKVALHRGDGDWLGSESDVSRLERSLPNCIENRNIGFKGFSHFDFTISKDVRPLVYDRVINLCGANR
ncbi:chromatin modification-related protein eaf-1-like isoform X2 [Drosophila teissieri]|uniref:chromatin modification-related protein eaf-1-like isoform X2 n=1 Tax=Drosophila teissieri TaxID=7243 RepID=UPI001CB9F9B6|nr:chromatin modification-related protein eaf-1-like isoform X2 [Drosophila teissieri]